MRRLEERKKGREGVREGRGRGNEWKQERGDS